MHYKVVGPTGELGNGQIKRPGNGTTYGSPSAAQRALDSYKGNEKLKVVPVETPPPPRASAKHGGARERSGVQMPSGQKAVAITVTFDPADRDLYLALGGGKLAKGLRKGAELLRNSIGEDQDKKKIANA